MLQRLAGGLIILGLAACSPGGFSASEAPLYAPTPDPDGQTVDQMLVGHRLIDAGEPALALEAYTRAAGELGLTGEVLSALGSANLRLGRLNQAEDLLRRAVAEDTAAPEALNNLGVVLMERGKTAEAAEIFRKAYALDNGESDSIRNNLRLALEKRDAPEYGAEQEQQYQLVRRGAGDYLIRLQP
ncbi:tetratricopeptide repeat protein [Litorisediminicola beolgyonensis]|uniref:Tetratricopeptide repeat protein n=1 Tax=Litorisediminicola beolgyonensis TaxID=1173614 RepID=A0ABW3ZHA9_9RHOB